MAVNTDPSFGVIVKEHRRVRDLTQAELARRVGCAAITIRKIEADALRPSQQIAERLAMALGISLEERAAFVRLARVAALADASPSPLPTPPVLPEEIGQEDLSGRAIRGYALGERLGAGGYGIVYRAVQPLVEREVAVKIILPQYADQPDFIRRFEAEAQLVARLEHPHIVPLYDYWREPGVAYLVMRLLRGGSLAAALQAGPLPLPTVAQFLEQIGAALHTAHRVGIIHRDLKPANVMLDEDNNAYLADFGIAKNLGNPNLADLTQPGLVIGSPAYFSPEQIMAEPVKPQTDIYCLGIMLYELLTGHKPFDGPSPIFLIQQHLNEPIPSLATYCPDLPPALDPVIQRATAKDQAERYPDVLNLLEDFRQALTTADHRPMTAATSLTPAPFKGEGWGGGLTNPYKGLRAFTEADAADFFGRETLIQELLARMGEVGDPASPSPRQELARFLAVVGPSGSGKSSVVRAGLLPSLREGGLPGSDKWFIVEMLPGAHPWEELEAALLRIAVNPPESLLAQLREDERGLLRAVRRVLPADESVELVLIIDQFEELFTLVADEDTRLHFLNSLVAAVLDPRSRLRLVITLRADFTDRPLRYVDFGELLRQRAEFVLPLTPDELEQAIAGPAHRVGLSLEPGLVAAISRDVGDEPGALPLLQYALTELFERSTSNVERSGPSLLTKQAYQAIGGVLGALARRADELYNSLDSAGQEAARQLFLRLITLGEGTEDTRRRGLRSEVEALSGDSTPSLTLPLAGGEDFSLPSPGGTTAGRAERGTGGEGETSIETVIELFGKHRLLTFDRDPITRGPTVEVAHEALLREWGQLREWLDASRNDIRLQRLLAAASVEWREAHQEPSFLLRGARLDQFAGWAETTNLALTPEERSFLEASLSDREDRRAEEEARQRRELETAQKLAETESRRASEQARSARRLRWLAVGLAVFLLAAVGAAWFASNQRSIAQNNFVTAERIRLASQAQIALDNGEGGDLPALLALRSLQHGYSPEADAALLTALKRGFTRQRYLGHTDRVHDARFSPDGRYVLTASDDHTARLWDTQTGQELRQFSGHTALLNTATFSPDGHYVLTNALDQTSRLWDVETGQELRRFTGHTNDRWGVAFSPDGRHVVGGDGAVARLWETTTGQELRQFVGHTDTIVWVEFSPDGRYVATSSNDKTARLWDAATGQELRQFSGHTDIVNTVKVSPDSQYLLTTSFDQTARLWELETGREIRRFVGHTSFVIIASFSPDGRYIVTGGNDKTARLWEAASGQEVRQFIGHTDAIWAATFSPDGRYVLTGSQDRSARLWEVEINTEPAILNSYTAGLDSMNVCAIGQYVVTGDGEGVLRHWDTKTDNSLRETTRLAAGIINAQAFSWDMTLPLGPPPRYVMTASGDGLARLWVTETGEELRQFSGHIGPVWDVVFSTDDAYVLTGGEDHTARLWEAQTGQEVRQLTGHSGPVRSVAFSSDNRYALTGSEDHTARLWDVQTGQEVRQLIGHSGPVRDVAFSWDGGPFGPPNSEFILTGSEDGTTRLWETETGREVRQFVGHSNQVVRVAFSPDGRYVLTGSADQTARLWDRQTGQLLRQFVGHTSPLLFVGFSVQGDVLTGDHRGVYAWQTTLEQVTDFTCTQLSRDFITAERARYNITDNTPTCPKFQTDGHN